MKKSMIAAVVASMFVAPVMASESETFFWGNTYGDYVNKGGLLTDNHSATDDSVVIGFEGGAVSENNNFYGFLEYDLTREETFGKLTNHFNLFSNVTLYTQAAQFNTAGFSSTNAAVGFGFTGIKGNGFNLTPWVGVNLDVGNDVTSPMIGWAGMYTLTNDVYMTHWNEVKFIETTDSTEFGGDFGLYHKLPHNMYAGIQYRYDNREGHYDDNIGIRVGMSL